MAVNQPLRVGFIGTGWTERVQIPAFRLGGLTVQAICSGHVENAHRVAKQYEIPEVYTSWQELINADTLDIVSIATTPLLHSPISVAALRAGKHVICEKPTALNVHQAEEMLAAAQATPGRLAIIDHELRFHPLRAHMRQLIRDGYVGNVLHTHMDWLYAHRLNPNEPWSWHSDASQGGGILGALGSHLFDLSRWMMGRIDGLTAQLKTGHFLRRDADSGAQQHVTSDDHANLMLRYASGALGTIKVSALNPDNLGMSITITGTEGALKIDYQDHLWGLHGPTYPRGEWERLEPPEALIDIARLPSASPFAVGSYYLARTLAADLSAGETILPEAASFYDGLVVQRALDAARRSAMDGVWVLL